MVDSTDPYGLADPDQFIVFLVAQLELSQDLEVTLGSALRDDLGLDSLQMIEALEIIDEVLGTYTPDGADVYEALSSFVTVGDAHNYVLALLKSNASRATTSGAALVPQLRGHLVELKPPMGQHYSRLYEIATSNEIAWRWRYGGAIPSYDEFLATFSSGVLSQMVITGMNSDRPLGLVVAYNANLQNRTAYFAAVIEPESVGTGLGAEAALVFLKHLFQIHDFTKIYLELPEYNNELIASGAGKYFLLEGRLKEHYFYGGRRWDQMIYAIYRDAFSPKIVSSGI